MLCMDESTDASASDTTVVFIFLPCIIRSSLCHHKLFHVLNGLQVMCDATREMVLNHTVTNDVEHLLFHPEGKQSRYKHRIQRLELT